MDSILRSSTPKPSSSSMVGNKSSLLPPIVFFHFILNNLNSSLPHLDTNEDGVLDEQELEALFTKEV